MTQKTIGLPDDVYRELQKHKQKGESFADLISRLVQKEQARETDLEDLAGALEEDNEWDQILQDLYNDRSAPARIKDDGED